MKNTINIEYKGERYEMVFNLNVMEQIQDEYGSVAKWGELTDEGNGEPNAKAVIFGFTAMLNEGVDIFNEDHDGEEGFTARKPFSKKQVGRIIMDMGFNNATDKLNGAVIDGVKSDEKNL